MTKWRQSRGRAFAMVAGAYACALGMAVAVALPLGAWHPLVVAGVADLAATLVIFAFSRGFDNSSVYDAYWSVAPLPIAAWWAWGAPGEPVRVALVLALVSWWGVRLTWNWARGWGGLHHEDWRYVDFRTSHPRLYWLISLFGLHLFPTVQVFLGLLAVWVATVGPRPLGVLDVVGVIVTAGAILLETFADRELRAFRAGAGEPGRILDTGLWSWSRHPNYLGEVGFWWGLALLGLAADPGRWWCVAGAVSITAMFVFVSIPLLERRSLARRPGYAAHLRRVPALFPWPRP